MEKKRRYASPRPCQECSGEFIPRLAAVVAGQGRFCSRKCAGVSRMIQKVPIPKIIEMYVKKKMTIRQIAEKTGMKGGSVWRRLRAHNVPPNFGKRVAAKRPKIGGRSVYIIIAEEKYGRPLASNEVVHHVDLDPTNNDPANLFITTQSLHVKLHWQLQYLAAEMVKDGKIIFDEQEERYKFKPNQGE